MKEITVKQQQNALKRIQRLQAQANSTTYDPERDECIIKIDKIRLKYNIDEEMIKGLSKGRRKRETRIQKHKILKNIYSHYIDFQDFYMRTGQHTIEAYGLTISFLDLKYDLDKLSDRKREAFLYNVIYDKRQEEVAQIMGVTTVTVGQYVDQSLLQLSKRYFYNEELNYNKRLILTKKREITKKSPKTDT